MWASRRAGALPRQLHAPCAPSKVSPWPGRPMPDDLPAPPVADASRRTPVPTACRPPHPSAAARAAIRAIVRRQSPSPAPQSSQDATRLAAASGDRTAQPPPGAHDRESGPQGRPDSLDPKHPPRLRSPSGKPLANRHWRPAHAASQSGMVSAAQSASTGLPRPGHRPALAIDHHLSRQRAGVVGGAHDRTISTGVEDRQHCAGPKRRKQALSREGVSGLSQTGPTTSVAATGAAASAGDNGTMPCHASYIAGPQQVVHRRRSKTRNRRPAVVFVSTTLDSSTPAGPASHRPGSIINSSPSWPTVARTAPANANGDPSSSPR